MNMNKLDNRQKGKRNIVRTFAALCVGMLSFGFTACDDDLDVTQAYPFTVETMPVPKELAQGETAEIRCELVREGEVLSYNVGQGVLLGHGGHPKSGLVRKLEAGNRDIFREYTAYCRYKGKPVRSIERRRKMEFLLLYEP